MTGLKRMLAVLIWLPLAAQAEQDPAVTALMHYASGVPACLAAADSTKAAEACIGQGAMACMEAEAAGYSNFGMVACTRAEQQVWDGELNRAYTSAMAVMRDLDAQDAADFPEYANRADMLRSAQRAWITLRDADCALEYAIWGAGSMRGLAGASCLLDETAQRASHLHFLGQAMQ